MSIFEAPAALDPTAAAAIRALGAQFDGEILAATRALFEGRWDMSLPPGGEWRADVAYGGDARQSLDLTTCGLRGAPLLLYTPGGGFVGGDKASYAHVGRAFARQGFHVAVMNYRLAPAHPWPAGACDVAAALDWLADHAGEFDADGASLYALAQSGGATHVSGALFDRRFRPRARVRAAVLMSGFYRMDDALAAANLRAYFGDDLGQYADRSPINAVAGVETPLALTFAEFDPAFLAQQTLGLAAALTSRNGRSPPLEWLESHNHVSPVLSLGAAPGDLAPQLARLLRKLGDGAKT